MSEDRDLDIRIAVEVMRVRVIHTYQEYRALPLRDPPARGKWLLDGDDPPFYLDDAGYAHALPYFSTEIADAFLVIDRIIDPHGPYGDQKWSFGLEYSSIIDWVADFTPRRNHPKAREYPAFQASGTCAAEAICRAALLAVESLQ